ncbi:MAG TPA: aminotransferase class I/II-fold pyridoxal phosphate-dependent enzyme [Thermoplasmata archaeon]|nr:aminotransferase class I/II-fold pyridoxal phosphate-dependent enzyme [Thermoplasmata archaeon]
MATGDTKAIHGTRRKGHGPLVTPVYLTSTWRLENARQGAALSAATAPPEFYTRWGNPTTRDLEEVLAHLEGGHGAIATGSGMGAISSAILAAVKKGDHVVAGKSLYSATMEMFTRFLPRLGVQCTFVDPREPGAWKEAVGEDTRLVYAETPANPTMMITDLREAARAARSIGAVSMCDSTFATPVNQRPIERGIDIVLHSATKYLGGHSDLVAGAIVAKDRRWFNRLWYTHKLLGPTLGPMEAFLVRRGLKTLGVRVRQHNRNAQDLAEFLEDHRRVRKVFYPGLKSFEQHRLARGQMDGFGGMLSFSLRGGHRACVRFVESVKVATLAVSLGGAETLVQHPASMTHGPLTAKERAASEIQEDLIRVSVGLEDIEDLREDFAAALRRT